MKEINCRIKRSRRAKLMRLEVFPDSSVVLTAPCFLPEFFCRRFIRQKTPWILKHLEKRKNSTGNIKLRTKKDYFENKKQAGDFIKERIERFNCFYGFSYNKITIRNQKRRWGSCSGKKNLNFNYRLLFLPSELADYVIVHELCHLGEMNHSKRFWRLVEKTIPDFLSKRKKIKGVNFY